MARKSAIRVGALGRMEFAAGYYGYTGSARGGFAPRVGRHLRRDKVLRWHIDYLLRRAAVRQVWLAPAGGECSRHQRLGRGAAAVRGFGCGDCSCASHLWRYAARPTPPRGWKVIKAGG